jgi:hypothetical protein
MSTLTIELPDGLAARLAAASQQQHVPPARIVQEALEQTLPVTTARSSGPPLPQPSALELLHDLVGCFDSGETDLATNPKHMEGFGQWRR